MLAENRARSGARGSDVGIIELERSQEHAGSTEIVEINFLIQGICHRVFVLLDQRTGSGVLEQRVLGVGREEQRSLGVCRLQNLPLQVL